VFVLSQDQTLRCQNDQQRSLAPVSFGLRKTRLQPCGSRQVRNHVRAIARYSVVKEQGQQSPPLVPQKQGNREY
jgi:hypothetical protein